MKKETLPVLLERLLKMAETGSHYAKDEYNKDRYAAIKEIADQLYAAVPGFEKLHVHPYDDHGYITPKVGVNAIIENENGELLLEKRMDDKCWGIPGGWCEVGFTAEENIIREIKEETGLNAKVIGLLDVICRIPSEKQLFTSYHILFRCEIISGTLKSSYESESVAWQHPASVQHWHFDHQSWFKKVKNKFPQ